MTVLTAEPEMSGDCPLIFDTSFRTFAWATTHRLYSATLASCNCEVVRRSPEGIVVRMGEPHTRTRVPHEVEIRVRAERRGVGDLEIVGTFDVPATSSSLWGRVYVGIRVE